MSARSSETRSLQISFERASTAEPATGLADPERLGTSRLAPNRKLLADLRGTDAPAWASVRPRWLGPTVLRAFERSLRPVKLRRAATTAATSTGKDHAARQQRGLPTKFQRTQRRRTERAAPDQPP